MLFLHAYDNHYGKNQVLHQCQQSFSHMTSCPLWPGDATMKWAAAWQNQQNGKCAQRRLGSAWAFTQPDQSSVCAQMAAKDPLLLHVDSIVWSDLVDAQADLSLCRLHRWFVGFVVLRLKYAPHPPVLSAWSLTQPAVSYTLTLSPCWIT